MVFDRFQLLVFLLLFILPVHACIYVGVLNNVIPGDKVVINGDTNIYHVDKILSDTSITLYQKLSVIPNLVISTLLLPWTGNELLAYAIT